MSKCDLRIELERDPPHYRPGEPIRGEVVADGTAAKLLAMEEENPRIRVVLRGADKGKAEAALEEVAGVEGVKPGLTEDQDAVAFEVTASRNEDVRQPIFRLAVDEGWELAMEFWKETFGEDAPEVPGTAEPEA